MTTTPTLTKHARQRMDQRSIPDGVAELILSYGFSRDAGDGARKYAFAKESFQEIKRYYGRGVSAAMQRYKLAYVVESHGRVITAAFSNSPIFNR